MRMHNPPYPGSIIKEDVLPELGITVTQAASQLGISRVQLSRFINGKSGVTPDLAIRLSKWIPEPTAVMWLHVHHGHIGMKITQKPKQGIPKNI